MLWQWMPDQKELREVKKTKYNKAFFYLLVAGVLCMWVSWVVGFIFLFLNKFYSFFGFLILSSPYETAIQIAGFIIFYIGTGIADILQ